MAARGRPREYWPPRSYASPGSGAAPLREPTQLFGRRHEALLLACVAQPDRTLSAIAASLGYTVAWCNRLYKSDMFQARLRELQAEQKERVLNGLTHKLIRNTELALDKQRDRLEAGASDRFILDSTSTLLRSLGYGQPAPAAPSQESHLHVHVDAETLRRARERVGEATPLKVIGGHSTGESSPDPRPAGEPERLDGFEPGDDL